MKHPKQIRRRHPRGLWTADGLNDAQRVERKKQELRKLLGDPWGFEALQEVRREEPRHMLRGLDGRTPERGRLARGLQDGDPKAARRGRPARWHPKVLGGLLAFAEDAMKQGAANNVKDFLRKLIRYHYPKATQLAIERKVVEISQRLYEHRASGKSRK